MSRTRPTSRHRRGPLAAFLALCAAYWAAAAVIVDRVPGVDRAGVDVTIRSVLAALALLGQAANRQGNLLHVGGRSVNIVSDCSPHLAYFIFAGVVLAFPSPWRQRLAGLAVGLLLIFLFNTIRIIALIQVLIWNARWFEFAHVYLWQTGTILILLGSFALWLRWLRPRGVDASVTHP
jgi:exosortase/archaeosortase family protein